MMQSARVRKLVMGAAVAGLIGGGSLAIAQPASAAVSCTTYKGHTAGWIKCTGNGTVRLVIDCKSPQISDYVGAWTYYNGSITLSGECNFGINSTQYQVK